MFAIQLLNATFATTPTGETWVWIWHNQADWAGKASAKIATKFPTQAAAQAMIDKFGLAQYGAQIVQVSP